MPHVAVSIVTWNSMKHLPEALASVAAQTHRDLSLIVVDNASTDGSDAYVRERFPQAMVLRNAKNLGFARGHNQAIAYARSRLRSDGGLYLLVMNPDAVMEPDYLEKLLETVERRPEIAAATGRILRMVRSSEETSLEGEKTGIIDTAGLAVSRSRRAYDRGEGRPDGPEFARTEEVFGVSGALALYRLGALQEVAFLPPGAAPGKEEYFDDDFFAYKEDVDLAWRLRLCGWKALYVPSAVAYHYRTAAGAAGSDLATLRNRFRKPKMVNYLSHRNHFLLVIKNDHVINWLLHVPFIAWYELRKFLAVLIFEPSSLRALPAALLLLPRMWRKRRAAFRGAAVKARDIRAWFTA